MYQELELEKGASSEEIKKSYRRLAMKHHPDKGGDPEKFKRISRAYETLSDDEKRRMYDMTGSDQGPPQMNFDFFNMFQKPQKPILRIHITLEDVYHERKKTYKMTFKIPCPKCITVCSVCKGSGIITQSMGGFMMVQKPCQTCQAQGKMGSGCGHCFHKKVIDEHREIHLDIGGTTQSGETVELKDSILEFIVIDDPRFKRFDQDLMYTQKISFIDSVHGTMIRIPHFSGELVVSTQDFGIIDPRKKYKVPGKGLKDGHLYILFDIQYPEPTERFEIKSATL